MVHLRKDLNNDIVVNIFAARICWFILKINRVVLKRCIYVSLVVMLLFDY